MTAAVPRSLFVSAALALGPFALHGLAREVDRALGLLLHSSLDLPGFVPLALSLVDLGAAGRAVATWTAAGAGLWLLAAAFGVQRAAAAAPAWRAALRASAGLFAPLLLRPACTLLALGALALRPAYPYGFTLPVALTQDWSFAQDAAAAAAWAAGLMSHAHARGAGRRVSAGLRCLARAGPRTSDVFVLAFLAYALLTPEGARSFEAHPGNEPKYLRMALALGHGLTLDVDTVTAPMEALPATPLAESLPRAVRRVAGDARELALAVARGDLGLDPRRMEASGSAHLTVRGRDGGAYHVLAPGPALLLAPVLRIERALNLSRATPGRLGLTLMAWNALAAALAAAIFALARDAGAHPAAAALASGAFALLPPQLFYSFQFYPEVPAALIMALVLRHLLFAPGFTARACAALGVGLAALPWLHQKYLPLWGALGLWALVRAVGTRAPPRALAALGLPQVLTLAFIALYNFSLTGSVRPDALFRALGREGVSVTHVGQGALGLLLDARYGLVPYVPLFLLAVAGLTRAGGEAARLRRALPAAGVYYLTVAAAENWTGSISNLGRFLLPLVPLAVAGAALVLPGLVRRPAALALGLMLAAWSARLAWLLWNDPLAANDSGVLLGASTFADGHVYLPNLLLRRWDDAAPALPAQLVVWAALAAAGVMILRGRPGRRPVLSGTRFLVGLVVAVLALASGLEGWPGRRGAARFPNTLRLNAGTLVSASGDVAAGDQGLTTAGGELTLTVRSSEPLEALRLSVSAPARLEHGAGPARMLRGGTWASLPLGPSLGLRGRRGNTEHLARVRVRLTPECAAQALGVILAVP